MIGRHRTPPAITEDQARLTRIQAAVDQARTAVRNAALTHRGNRELVNLALDVENLLAGKE